MIRLSLRLRSFVAAIIALLFFIPLTVITLERAFTNSLSESMLQQLRVQSLTLISEFEMENDTPYMPEQLFNDQLNIPDSGLYAFVLINGKTVWQSISTLNWQQQPDFPNSSLGSELFLSQFDFSTPYFLFAYTAEFETTSGYAPVSFYILQDRKTFDDERSVFAKTLWYWLGLIAALLLALLFVSLNTAISPIDKLIEQIDDAQAGKTSRINKTYPPELEKLKSSVNQLLDSEETQRTRYKNSLSDLAHSLKTPLAVLTGNTEIPHSAKEPLTQIGNIIQRQLKRAVAGTGAGWEKSQPIAPVITKLVNAMDKVYADKELSIQQDVNPEASFRGDTTDIMELIGNLLDNACKAANSCIKISAQPTANLLIISVEDDGPGIPQKDRKALLTRGKRLDSYNDGQGIGMALVCDLVSAYKGKLEIHDSPLGGALVMVHLPQ